MMDTPLYLISNLFLCHSTLRFVSLFYRGQGCKRVHTSLMLILFFVASSTVHLTVSNPFANMAVTLFMLIVSTYRYDGKFSIRIVSTALIYICCMLFDSMTYHFLSFVKVDDTRSMLSNAVVSILIFMLVLILEKLFMVSGTNKLTLLQWTAIISIPLGSVGIVILTFVPSPNNPSNPIIISTLFIINIMVFYLYEVITRQYEAFHEQELIRQQNKAYENQLKVIEESQLNLRTLRHDLKNHVFAMEEMLKNEKYADVSLYLKTMHQYLNPKNEYVHSGLLEIDSIINYKLLELAQMNTEISVSVNIPQKANIEIFDLIIVLGNLLDNALEAVAKCEQKKFSLHMELDRSVLYIDVINSCQQKPMKENGQLITSKGDLENHGIGLNSVSRVAEKYNGTIQTKYANKEFAVSLMLYEPDIR